MLTAKRLHAQLAMQIAMPRLFVSIALSSIKAIHLKNKDINTNKILAQ
jgi:hypothetical protein